VRPVLKDEPGLKPGKSLATNLDCRVHARDLVFCRRDFRAQRFDTVSQVGGPVGPRSVCESRIHAASLPSACRSI
jgi:hypothetical protein